jgi:hypothetical protein
VHICCCCWCCCCCCWCFCIYCWGGFLMALSLLACGVWMVIWQLCKDTCQTFRAWCIPAATAACTLRIQGQERKQAGAPFQLDQCDKIFRVLGHPSPSSWPLLEALPFWAKNTGEQGGVEGAAGCCHMSFLSAQSCRRLCCRQFAFFPLGRPLIRRLQAPTRGTEAGGQ